MFVNTASALEFSPRLRSTVERMEPPIPSISPVPFMNAYAGSAMLSAARPSLPMASDTKNVSASM